MRVKRSLVVASLTFAALTVRPRSARAQAGGLDPLAPEPLAPADVIVDDDLACPGATETSIQAAVTGAFPGAIIQVCPGLYPEQIAIDKPLTIRGRAFNAEDRILIKPAGVVANTTSLVSGAPIAAIVLVDNTTGVTLSALTVDGGDNAIGGCAPSLAGIYYRNASGAVTFSAVRNVQLGPGLEGCQSGNAIFVQSDLAGPGTSNVTIRANSVHDYQKNGITANEVGTTVSVLKNAVTGIGPTDDIAQNGIQLGFGATGVIADNEVADHIYSLCSSIESCSFVSTNILVFDSDGSRVVRNQVGRSQVNVYFQGSDGFVRSNDVFDALVFDGIDIIGDRNKVAGNNVFNSDEAAVFIQGNSNDVGPNVINDARVGIQQDAGNTGNDTSGNRFYNVDLLSETLPVLQPAHELQRIEPLRP